MSKRKFYQLNQFIKAPELRVVAEDAKQIGVMKKEDALRLAIEQDKDLIIVAPNANPPVAKIIGFAKFKYQEQQKDASGRKSARSVDIKEIRFTPFIADGDYQQRIKKAQKFLGAGDKVRLTVKFVGRQITRKEFGEKLLNRALGELSDVSTIEFHPRLQGKLLFTQLQPKK